MATCGECAFCQPHPQAPTVALVGQCHGVPPVTLLLPVMEQPQGRVMKPNAAQQMHMQLTSVRASVQHSDVACSLFVAKVKH